MKRLILFLTTIISLSAVAQTGKERELVTDDYNRNSLSVIIIDRGDKHDKFVQDVVKDIDFGDKFDLNKIVTDHITLKKSRDEAPLSSDIDAIISDKGIEHEVISYWFDSDKNGLMSGELIENRGRFNASDEEVLTARSAKLGEDALRDKGYELINNSYVLVLDYNQFKEEKTESKDIITGKITIITTEYVTLTARVYKVVFSEDDQNEFYNTCWIDEETPQSEINARRAAFKKMNIVMKPIAASTVKSGVKVNEKRGKDAAIIDAMKSSYAGAMRSLETKISEWLVVTAIKEVRPIQAKIGTKEGLKNTHRYMAYQAKRKVVNGEEVTYSQKTGYVRATKVANNTADATGDSAMSEFYQISHIRNVKAGELLKQSNDLGMGITLGYAVGGLSEYNVNIDYLMKMNTKGRSSYALIDLGYDIMPAKEFNMSSLSLLSEGVSFINASLGLGYGIRATRLIEIVPSVMAGIDYMSFNSESSDDDDLEDGQSAYYGKLGIKANFTVAYPLQLVAGVNYSLIVSEGAVYKAANDLFEAYGLGRRNGGLAFMVGVKWIF